jgi:glycosyltransferase involved in cell wall biosynthesis
MEARRPLRDPLHLLARCARVLIEPDTEGPDPGLFDAPIDWNALVPVAFAHGMTPLLAEASRRFAGAGVPWEIREALALHLGDNRERTDELIAELFRLIDELGRQHVEVIPFKGAVLAELAYGDAALRRAGDIDFFVHREHLDAVCALLRASGYREWVERSTGRPLSAAEEAAYRRLQCEYAFARPHDQLVVEPHWAIVPHTLAVPIDYAGIWRRARALRFHGREILGLEDEDLLLIVCVHAAKHEWSELRWICDVAALLRRCKELDLPLALERAREQGSERMLLIGLRLAEALLASALPESVARRVAGDRVAGQLAARVIERLEDGRGEPPSIFALSRFRLAMRERRRDRLRYALRTLLTPGIEHQRLLALPASLFFLYALVKPAHDHVALPAWLALKRARRAARSRLRTWRGARRVLVVDWVPHVEQGAGAPRMNALLQLLVRCGYRVTLHPVVACHEPDAALHADVPDAVEVVRGSGLDELETFLAGRAFAAILACRPPVLHRMLEILARHPEYRSRARLVYDSEAIFAAREIEQRRLLGEPVEPEQAARMLAQEAERAAQADAVIAVSQGEAEILRRHGARSVHVLSHVVRPQPTPRPFAGRAGLLFVGRLAEDGWPNTDAFAWFRDRVFDEVRRRLAEQGVDVELTVAGMTGARELRARPHPAIRVLGVVGDLVPLYDRARVFVAPTRFAAGVPAKVYEAAAHGLPIVATRLLADQLGWRPGADLLAAEVSDAAAFAERVVELYLRPELWSRVRENALARVAEECSPERGTRTLVELLGPP